MPENWKPVVGFEKDYEVSDLGRVKRITPGKGARPNHILRPGAQASGHLHVNLRASGKTHGRQIHRLVLEAFVGPCPTGMEACHNNSVPRDNRLSNLRWDTRKNNARDMVEAGSIPLGEDHKWAELEAGDVRAIRLLKESGESVTGLAKAYGVTTSTIYKLLQRRSWKHVE